MNFSKTILLVTTLAFAFSCNQSSSGGKALTPEEIIQQEEQQLKNAPSVENYEASIKPDRFDVQQADLTYEQQKEKYKDGCKTPGSYESVHELDKSIVVGSEITKEFGVAQLLNQNTSSKTNTKVTLISTTQISTEINYEYIKIPGTPFSSVDQFFVSQPHMTQTTTFEFDPNGVNYPKSKNDSTMNLTAEAQNWIAQNSPMPAFAWMCSVGWNTDAITDTSKTDKGVYLIMGRLVTSYRTVTKRVGPVKCTRYSTASGDDNEAQKREIQMGQGTSTTVMIVSNEVGAENLIACGGNRLYYGSTTTLDNNKIVSSWAEKFTKLPLK